MRTTIDLSDEFLRQAEHRAGNEGIPLRQVIESGLRMHLMGRRDKGGYRLSRLT